jgi:hypothetical protein
MASNQQPQGGNNMAALLGNMRGQLGQPQRPANFGGGLQAPTMGGGQAPQYDPRAIAANPAGFQQWQQGAQQQEAAQPGSTMLGGLGGWQRPGGVQPMPSTGAPGGGAAGKAPGMKQAIGQLPGGPPIKSRLGGALGNKIPRPRAPGMQPNPATAYGR